MITREKPIALLAAVCIAAAYLFAPSLTACAEDSKSVTEADRQAIRAVIERQIEAFRRDDGSAAFSFASPTIRGIFGSPEVFMAMVRRDYQPVYRPREVSFRDIVHWRGQPTQRVWLVGPDNVPVLAYYQMQRQPNGGWKINGGVLAWAEEEST